MRPHHQNNDNNNNNDNNDNNDNKYINQYTPRRPFKKPALYEIQGLKGENMQKTCQKIDKRLQIKKFIISGADFPRAECIVYIHIFISTAAPTARHSARAFTKRLNDLLFFLILEGLGLPK